MPLKRALSSVISSNVSSAVISATGSAVRSAISSAGSRATSGAISSAVRATEAHKGIKREPCSARRGVAWSNGGGALLFSLAVARPGAAAAYKRDVIHGIMVTTFSSSIKTSKIIKLS